MNCACMCCHSVLYGDELTAIAQQFPKSMRLDVVRSLQETNADGNPMYGESLNSV